MAGYEGVGFSDDHLRLPAALVKNVKLLHDFRTFGDFDGTFG